jgi:serine/threonine-protein kinase
MTSHDPAPPPLFAGKFRLVRLLGRGAMGEVWLAVEEGPRNFRRQVAVKRLLATSDLSDYARESFVAEAQVIARLDHPNIVRLVELGETEEDHSLYLVLDFVDGAALDRLLKKHGALSPAAVAFIGREVSKALDAVHRMADENGQNYGVVHRDVSPANILISRDGRAASGSATSASRASAASEARRPRRASSRASCRTSRPSRRRASPSTVAPTASRWASPSSRP